MKIKDLQYKLQTICWTTINVFLVWTALLKPYTSISNIALLFLMVLSWSSFSSRTIKNVLYAFFFVCILIAVSLIQGNQLSLIFRFSFIVFSLLYAYHVKLDKTVLLKGLFWTSFPYCICLLLLEFYFLTMCTEQQMQAYRHLAQVATVGDVYIKYNLFYAIQLVGGAAIPFLYIISFFTDLFPKKRRKLYQTLYFVSIVIIGNFAYLLTLFAFHLFYYFYQINTKRKFNCRILLALVTFPVAFVLFFDFVSAVLDEKKADSNATRIDQAEVLLNDMGSSSLTTIFGRGLGNTVDVQTKFRDYTGDVYYELQSLYFFNQMGVLFFFVFLAWHLYYTRKFITRKEFYIVYLLYVSYAITNPYILNTNQFVVIVTLVSLCRGMKRGVPSKLDSKPLAV